MSTLMACLLCQLGLRLDRDMRFTPGADEQGMPILPKP